jgi:26S proteasome regulatory subunit N7
MSLVLEKAAKVIEKGGDWDRRNRLKAYTAVSHILVRDLEKASKLLVDGIATFSCTELCEYPEFITYAVVTSLLYLPRTELKKCVIDGSEILQVAKDIPVVVSLPVCGFVRLPIVHTWLFITYASHILRLK